MHTTLFALSFRGIGHITTLELRSHFGNTIRKIQYHRSRNSDIIKFDFSGSIQDLLQLRTAEDLFYWINTQPLSGEKSDLENFQRTRLDLIEVGLSIHRQTINYNPKKRRPTFRIIVQANDTKWKTYRRQQIQNAVEQKIGQTFKKWKLVPDNADLEFWLIQVGKQVLLGLRLTDKTMRHRTYKTSHFPGSLRPTIAAALITLSELRSSDIFLDPMCGAGTILIERALTSRYRLLIGGDIRKKAVHHTLTNFGSKHQPRKIFQWDATYIPLNDLSVDKVGTNLPWGRHFGSLKENQNLYADVLKEIHRVLKPGGRAVCLTSDRTCFKKVLQWITGMNLVNRSKEIVVLGRRADIFVLEKPTSFEKHKY